MACLLRGGDFPVAADRFTTKSKLVPSSPEQGTSSVYSGRLALDTAHVAAHKTDAEALTLWSLVTTLTCVKQINNFSGDFALHPGCGGLALSKLLVGKLPAMLEPRWSIEQREC
jgi:hypothetical protein